MNPLAIVIAMTKKNGILSFFSLLGIVIILAVLLRNPGKNKLFILHGVVGEEVEMPEEMSACNCATTSNEVVRIARNEVTSPFLDSIAKTGFFRQTLKSTTCLFPDYPCMKSLYTDAHDRKGECTPIRTEITIRVYKSDMDGDDKMANISIPVDVGCACNAVNR